MPLFTLAGAGVGAVCGVHKSLLNYGGGVHKSLLNYGCGVHKSLLNYGDGVHKSLLNYGKVCSQVYSTGRE